MATIQGPDIGGGEKQPPQPPLHPDERRYGYSEPYQMGTQVDPINTSTIDRSNIPDSAIDGSNIPDQKPDQKPRVSRTKKFIASAVAAGVVAGLAGYALTTRENGGPGSSESGTSTPNHGRPLEAAPLFPQIMGDEVRFDALARVLGLDPALPASSYSCQPFEPPQGQLPPAGCFEFQNDAGGYTLQWFTGEEGDPGIQIDVRKDVGGVAASRRQFAYDAAPESQVRLELNGRTIYPVSAGLVLIYGDGYEIGVWAGGLSEVRTGDFSLIPSDPGAEVGPTIENTKAFALTLF
jgi:hypothetical protein